jgi:hypothetical protein
MRPELVFVGIGILSILIGLPLADRRIPPNRWYGVRIRATFAAEHIWYEANAQAGRDLTALGLLMVVLTLAIADKVPSATYVMWCAPLFGFGAMLLALRSVRLANRLWRERGDDRSGESRRPR